MTQRVFRMRRKETFLLEEVLRYSFYICLPEPYEEVSVVDCVCLCSSVYKCVHLHM